MDLLKRDRQITPLLSPIETAKILGVTAKTLAVWRCTRRYPLAYVRVGRSIMYRTEDVQGFIDSRIMEA